MSLRKRLLIGIVTMLTVLWIAAMGWFLVHVRAELQQVLDVRLASSARMVQGLLSRGQFELSERGMSCPVISTETGAGVLPSQLTCQLWSLEGDVLSTSGDAPPLIEEPREDGFSNRLVDGEMWRVFTLTDEISGVRLATAERQALRSELVRDAALAVSLPFTLVLPGMVLLVWVGVGRGLAPLKQLRDSIRHRHANALDALPQDGAPPEVEPLVAALNRLFERLRSSIERERRFHGDAAHELRTPLAGVKTQLQVAQAAEGETHSRALARAELGLDRMSRLVEQMLTLARVDSDANLAEPGPPADAVRVIADVKRELSFLMQARGVSLAVSASSESVPVRMPLEL
ncbi:MAG TPA: histidine kinase dimerization/phospho-acceptor domain-containing protein, partial [Wenzhouxiangella sp.]|nr:histidine kinase dimerization/phospho-acceptor domain-containing protein [Wenzhouxiangella sp.]